VNFKDLEKGMPNAAQKFWPELGRYTLDYGAEHTKSCWDFRVSPTGVLQAYLHGRPQPEFTWNDKEEKWAA
jgi:hypothetical protein